MVPAFKELTGNLEDKLMCMKQRTMQGIKQSKT